MLIPWQSCTLPVLFLSLLPFYHSPQMLSPFTFPASCSLLASGRSFFAPLKQNSGGTAHLRHCDLLIAQGDRHPPDLLRCSTASYPFFPIIAFKRAV